MSDRVPVSPGAGPSSQPSTQPPAQPYAQPYARPFTRRSLLVGALAGTALVAVGCTRGNPDTADAVTPAQVGRLADQVRVQEVLVAAYGRATAAAPALGVAAAPLADQARAQLDRLRSAAPGTGSTPLAGSPAAGSPGGPPADVVGARAWLRAQVAAAADAHASACVEMSGGRAALLGSIAAGLRGQDGLLA
jgi:hypothetical protein